MGTPGINVNIYKFFIKLNIDFENDFLKGIFGIPGIRGEPGIPGCDGVKVNFEIV